MALQRISAYMLVLGIAASGLTALCRAETLDTDTIKILGVVMNQTITHAGNRFYQDFSQRWQSSAAVATTNILIKETIVPGRGSLIWVLVADQVAYRLPLSRRTTDFTPHIEAAIQRGEQLSVSLAQPGATPDLAGNGL